MSEVYFYHLTHSPLEQVLPELLDMCCKRELRVCVRGTDDRRMEWLDDRIWVHQDDAFLPHGVAGGPHDTRQPILLTTGPSANVPDILMLVDGSRPDMAELSDYQRVCILFDGNSDAAVETARSDWKAVVEAGVAAQYWAQDGGKWQKRAESASSA